MTKFERIGGFPTPSLNLKENRTMIRFPPDIHPLSNQITLQNQNIRKQEYIQSLGQPILTSPLIPPSWRNIYRINIHHIMIKKGIIKKICSCIHNLLISPNLITSQGEVKSPPKITYRLLTKSLFKRELKKEPYSDKVHKCLE